VAICEGGTTMRSPPTGQPGPPRSPIYYKGDPVSVTQSFEAREGAPRTMDDQILGKRLEAEQNTMRSAGDQVLAPGA
jgi:hypothetical protein